MSIQPKGVNGSDGRKSERDGRERTMACLHTSFQDSEDRVGPAGRNGPWKKLPHAKGQTSRISLLEADGRGRETRYGCAPGVCRLCEGACDKVSSSNESNNPGAHRAPVIDI